MLDCRPSVPQNHWRRGSPGIHIVRLALGPIVGPDAHPSIGVNIQGPSLIRVPDWIEQPLGKYYLYFADHKGSYIRLAFADELLGPWQIYPPGSLQLGDSRFLTQPPPVPPDQRTDPDPGQARRSHGWLEKATTPHIASPDVHVDHEGQRIRMYFHGLEAFASQVTRVTESSDGIHFSTRPEVLGRTYFRVFKHRGATFALAMPGQLYRSEDGLQDFKRGPCLFNPDMRHSALLKRDDTLHVFWTQVGDAPESILHSTIELKDDWTSWRESRQREEVLRPEHEWEGAHAPLVPSIRSTAYGTVNQLRDPAIFEEDGRVFLLYAVAGESGIAIAEVFL